MARQKGIIKLKGTIGDVSFYKTQDGHLAREKGGVDGERIKNDPAFVRTRENGFEFGSSASAGKLLRDALRPMLMNTADNRVVSRLTKLMTQIKDLDTTSARGERSVGIAFGGAPAKALLKGFNFNSRAILGAVLFKPYSVDPLTSVISINNLIPQNDIAFPVGATHMKIKGAIAQIDFTSGIKTVNPTNDVNLPIDGISTNVTLTPVAVPTGAGILMWMLQIEFFQELNAVQYSLKNGAYNALAIIEVL